MSLPQSEVDKIKEIVTEIFYSPATNGKSEKSIISGVHKISELFTKEREKANAELQAERERVKELAEALERIQRVCLRPYNSEEQMTKDFKHIFNITEEALSNHTTNQNK